jgi:hypothetical protein
MAAGMKKTCLSIEICILLTPNECKKKIENVSNLNFSEKFLSESKEFQKSSMQIQASKTCSCKISAF